MEQRHDSPGFGVPADKWFDIQVKGDWIVSDDALTCRDLTVEGNLLLIGNPFCRNINVKGNCIIYGSIYSCQRVNVQGDMYVYRTSESAFYKNGGLFSPSEDVEIGGDLICEQKIRARKNKIKVGGDVITKEIECGSIYVGGDILAYPGTIDSSGEVCVLGDITVGYPIDAKEVYCGGKYTCKFHWMKETTLVHEQVKQWRNLT